MKNKFRIGEIVTVDGISAIYEKHFSGLGIIEEKDYYYNQYLVTMLSNEKEDWFSEESIRSVMDRRIKKKEKYKVVLAIDKRGMEYILKKVKEMPNKYNNILEKVDFYKEYKAYRKKYIILAWTSTYWSENNFVVKCIQESFKELRKQNIAYVVHLRKCLKKCLIYSNFLIDIEPLLLWKPINAQNCKNKSFEGQKHTKGLLKINKFSRHK